MSEENGNVSITFLSEGSILAIGFYVLVILFDGEPDLMQAIIHYLMKE